MKNPLVCLLIVFVITLIIGCFRDSSFQNPPSDEADPGIGMMSVSASGVSSRTEYIDMTRHADFISPEVTAIAATSPKRVFASARTRSITSSDTLRYPEQFPLFEQHYDESVIYEDGTMDMIWI